MQGGGERWPPSCMHHHDHCRDQWDLSFRNFYQAVVRKMAGQARTETTGWWLWNTRPAGKRSMGALWGQTLRWLYSSVMWEGAHPRLRMLWNGLGAQTEGTKCVGESVLPRRPGLSRREEIERIWGKSNSRRRFSHDGVAKGSIHREENLTEFLGDRAEHSSR